MNARYLRLSITDRCNLQCLYCRSDEKSGALNKMPLATEEELVLLVAQIASRTPLNKIRITGGEPLLHPRVISIVEVLRTLLPQTELCLTTNGICLPQFAEPLRAAGLNRLNISLDAPEADSFKRITSGLLEQVLAGLDAARAAGFTGLRLNAVLMRSINQGHLADLVRLAIRYEAQIRFIELMPMGPAATFYEREYFSSTAALDELNRSFAEQGRTALSGTSRPHVFLVENRLVKVGFITPISHPFCGQCDRLRLDCRGRLFACLREDHGRDLLQPLKSGDQASVLARIDDILASKGSPLANWPDRHMQHIGG